MSHSPSLPLTSDKARFQNLWRRHLITPDYDDSAAIYQRLIDAYNEPQRVYHTQQHIEDCLVLFDDISEYLEDADAVELAIWFHDVIYQLGAADNELLSAELFEQLTQQCFEVDFCQRVLQHIIATLHCETELDDHDSRYMVDIDLSSFGMPWEKFMADSKNVRDEMLHIPDQEFYRKQYAFQQSLLSRGRFYQSDYFFKHYEQSARDNIADYFALLQNRFELTR